MGRVTFEGPVKSNVGFEFGEPGSRSSVAGNTIISSAGSVAFNFTSGIISANLNTGTLTTGSVSLIPSSTAQTIRIGGAITGWNNASNVLGTGGAAATAAAVSMNMSLGNVFYTDWIGSVGATITPVGGYAGQQVTLIVRNYTVSALILQSSSSVAFIVGSGLIAGSPTGVAILPGSVGTLTFTNIGPGVASVTPAATSVLLLTEFIPNTQQVWL